MTIFCALHNKGRFWCVFAFVCLFAGSFGFILLGAYVACYDFFFFLYVGFKVSVEFC